MNDHQWETFRDGVIYTVGFFFVALAVWMILKAAF